MGVNARFRGIAIQTIRALLYLRQISDSITLTKRLES